MEPRYLGCYSRLMEDAGTNRLFYLPRLPREYYQGDAVVHWTLPIFNRQQGWLTVGFHAGFRELLFHTAAREGLLCPAYCLMPDHLHLVWMGLRRDSDQMNGMSFLRRYLKAALAPFQLQHQSHDHVLKQEERRRNAFAAVCAYIHENPVRSKLVDIAADWPFSGTLVPGYPTLHPDDQDFWPKFWEVYLDLKHSDAGNLVRPPIGWARPLHP